MIARMTHAALTIAITIVMSWAVLPAIVQAQPDAVYDPCRGRCDQLNDHFCLEWTASCQRCLSSSKEIKCIDYFRNLANTEDNKQSSTHQHLEPTSEFESTSRQAVSTETTAKTKQTPTPKSSNQNVPKRRNNDDQAEAETGAEAKDGAPTGYNGTWTTALIVASCGLVVVGGIGLTALRRQGARRSPNRVRVQLAENQQNTNRRETVVVFPMQEVGAPGGPVILPEAQVFMRNENENDDDQDAMGETAV